MFAFSLRPLWRGPAGAEAGEDSGRPLRRAGRARRDGPVLRLRLRELRTEREDGARRLQPRGPVRLQLRGFVHPPKSAEYVFAIAGDDEAELFLSKDGDPKNKELIACARQPTEPGNFSQFPSQKSKPFRLDEGKKYYIEAVHKQNTGRGHLSVGWASPGVSSGAVIPGAYLSPYPSGEKGTITHEVWRDPAGWSDNWPIDVA